MRRLVGVARALGRGSLLWADAAGFPDAAAGETYADYVDVVLDIWAGAYTGSWAAEAAALTAAGAAVVVAGPFYVTAAQPGAPGGWPL